MSALIIVPVDGSTFSEAALAPAFRIARHMDAPVAIVTVHEPIPTLDMDRWEVAAHEWSTEYMTDLLGRIEAEGLEVSTRVLTGQAAEAIEKEVAERGADLVVMSSHGRGAFSRLWLGSTSDAFVRKSSVPVLLIKPDEEGKGLGDTPFENVLITLDGSKLAETILDRAIEMGRADFAKFTLVRVYPYPAEFASAYMPHTVQLNAEIFEEGKREAEAYLEQKVAELRARDLEVSGKLVVDASPAAGILHAAEECEADLIAMATHGRGGLNRALLGSVADRVLRAAHVPVLLAKPPKSD